MHGSVCLDLPIEEGLGFPYVRYLEKFDVRYEMFRPKSNSSRVEVMLVPSSKLTARREAPSSCIGTYWRCATCAWFGTLGTVGRKMVDFNIDGVPKHSVKSRVLIVRTS